MKTLALTQSKLQPPPTKTEVIDALTRLRIEKLMKENKEGVTLRKKLTAEAEKELVQLCQLDPGAFSPEASIGSWWSGDKKLVGVQVEMEIAENRLPTQLRKKLIQIHSLPERERHFIFNEERKIVSMGMSGMGTKDERVNALLKDESSKAALVKMLEAIS